MFHSKKKTFEEIAALSNAIARLENAKFSKNFDTPLNEIHCVLNIHNLSSKDEIELLSLLNDSLENIRTQAKETLLNSLKTLSEGLKNEQT